MKDTSTNICERVDDLVGFLYGELNEADSHRFELHLQECAACGAEYAGFGQIRQSLVAWRDQSLGRERFSAVAATTSLAPAGNTPPMRGKSALAALREFFVLSPLWLRGATAFATVLFCVCGVLAVAYLNGRPVPRGVAASDGRKLYTPEEVDKQVATAVEKIRQERLPQEQPIKVPVSAPQKSVNRTVGFIKPRYAVADNLRRPFTEKERQELAADLRLTNSKDEDDLDLTSDSDRP